MAWSTSASSARHFSSGGLSSGRGPAPKQRNNWGALLYLALADIVMTMLSGFLTFCDRPVYPYYVNHPNPFGVPVLTDQVLGAVIMWVLVPSRSWCLPW